MLPHVRGLGAVQGRHLEKRGRAETREHDALLLAYFYKEEQR